MENWNGGKKNRLLERDIENDYEVLQGVVENSDSQNRKNNDSLNGLMERMEGENLVGYLEELFFRCEGSDNRVEIKIIYAYWISLPQEQNQCTVGYYD